MIPGPAALCEGTVTHTRLEPTLHRFVYPVSTVWIDPDHPEELCDLHPAWSHRHVAPARFRRRDYGMASTGSLTDQVRRALGNHLGRDVTGPVRMLTQVRRWGWLFNPITIYFLWDATHPGASGHRSPVGAVLEVTNTPWKERVHYPIALDVGPETFTSEFDKALHVSPFLGMDHRYRLIIDDRDDRVGVTLDVLNHNGHVVLHTAMRLDRCHASRRRLHKSLVTTPFPTHRVSAGIHRQALALWAKRVPTHRHTKPRHTTELFPSEENAR